MSSRFDDSGMEILEPKKCIRILHDHSLGRIGFTGDDGEPLILPVAYRFHQGRIYFLSSGGAKLSQASRGGRVAFEVDGWDDASGSGWSVLVRGSCSVVSAEGQAEAAESGLKPWLRRILRPMHWIQIVPEVVTGRRLPGPQASPDWD